MKHLTQEQRYKIESLTETHNQSLIAEIVGVSKSTISRELNRNSSKSGTYGAKAAQKCYQKRRQRNRYKLTGESETEIINRICSQHSPEQISGRLQLEGKQSISHETIYQYIYQDKRNGGCLWENLRQGRKRRRKRRTGRDRRGIIPDKVMISERPAIVDSKIRLGDYEGDTIIGANHQGAIVTLTERKTKLVLMKKVKDRTAESVEKAVVFLLKNAPIAPLTITFDNGKEFTNHKKIAMKLGCKVYFANPYHSWERGLNENTNGLIRQYIPKKTNFDLISQYLITKVQKTINKRPRKTLNFLSPLEFLILFNS